jgi:hypothetical protein
LEVFGTSNGMKQDFWYVLEIYHFLRIISTFLKARVGSVFDHKQLWAFTAMA